MNADIKGCLNRLNTAYRSLEHRGERMTKAEAKKVLEYGLKKGYETIHDFTDEEVDNLLKESR